MRETVHDESLMLSKILEWDETAFRMLYEVYYKALVSYALQLTGSMEIAEDIVQEQFTKLWERKGHFNSMAQLRAWLYNCTRNAVVDHQRHLGVVQGYEQQQKEYKVSDEGEEEFFTEEVFRQLFAEIDRLPERQREVFLMLMDGRKNADIAHVMQITIETVKKQRKRAIATLKSRLGHNAFILTVLFLQS